MWLAIKRELRDLLSLWLAPGLAAILPWHWCLSIYWRLSASTLLMREEVAGSRGGRQMLGLDGNDTEFDRRFRFGFLLEHADVFRTFARGWRGLAATMPMRPDGATDVGGGLCFFFNFNQGLPALATLRAAGFNVHLVYRSLDQRPAGVGWFRYGYMRLRLRMVAAVCGNQGIGTGGARERIASAIAAGALVCVAADTPPRPNTGLVPVRFPGGRDAWWRSGVLKLALQLPGPIRCFNVHLDWSTRRRTLQLMVLPDSPRLEELVWTLNEEFLGSLERQPELWFYWPGPQGFFLFPEGARLE
jgi:phosphatidylinositol dimannoside acyltransferase